MGDGVAYRENGTHGPALHWLLRYWPFLALILFALLLRSPYYGNPDANLDEDYYLLVGDRMLHGALPYVDLWDRKPMGLFLIYAAIRLLGGDGVIQYQIVASLFAGSTAGMIWLLSRRAAGDFGGIFAGILYLFWINMFTGYAGQSPVFYNLMSAFAAGLAFAANDSSDPHRIGRLGNWAMLWWGLILQVKYTAAPEGIFFGLWFLWRLRAVGLPQGGLIRTALQFMIIALIPTALVTIAFAASGHFDDFFYANFQSIFSRGQLGPEFIERAKTFYLYATPPLAIVVLAGLLRRWQAGERLDFAMLVGWSIAALAGFMMIGNYYDHYFLPCLLPAFIVAAPLFTRSLIGVAVPLFLIVESLIVTHFPDIAVQRQKRIAIAQLTDATLPYVGKGRCLFIYDGPATLYRTTHACIPTRYAYPDHLSNIVERHSVGTDTQREIRRVLASRPGAIITADLGVLPGMDPLTVAPLQAALDRDYVCVAAIASVGRTYHVRALKALVAPGTPSLACPSAYLH